jgi:hypothetical protein
MAMTRSARIALAMSRPTPAILRWLDRGPHRRCPRSHALVPPRLGTQDCPVSRLPNSPTLSAPPAPVVAVWYGIPFSLPLHLSRASSLVGCQQPAASTGVDSRLAMLPWTTRTTTRISSISSAEDHRMPRATPGYQGPWPRSVQRWTQISYLAL